MDILQTMSTEMKTELKRIADFWKGLKDENGGFCGFVSYDLKRDFDAPKGGILNSRILWFFSNLYMTTKDEDALKYAEHAYKYLKNACIDKEFGGVYWLLTGDKPFDTIKHTYNQAFSIYALASYYRATGDGDALKLALTQFNLIESKCTDAFGYKEAFNRDWTETGNEKLSEGGYDAKKTMNTLLHVMEAYTELYIACKDENVKNRLRYTVDLAADKLFSPETGRLKVFLDAEMNEISDIYSYGHDIEAAWLIDRAVDALEDDALTKQTRPITAVLVESVTAEAFDGAALFNQKMRQVVDKTRVWWVQAEAIVGSVNYWQKQHDSKNVDKYLQNAQKIWNYIKEYMIDTREGAEWFWQTDENDKPSEKPIVEPWKCPYHNGRMCMEVIRRNELEKL